jgi:hypothetical protein
LNGGTQVQQQDLIDHAIGVISNAITLIKRLPEDAQTVEWEAAARSWLDGLVANARGGEIRMEYAVLWEAGGALTTFRSIQQAADYIMLCRSRDQGPDDPSRGFEGHRSYTGDPDKALAVERQIIVWAPPLPTTLPIEHWSRYQGPWHVPAVGRRCCDVTLQESPPL